MCCYHYKEPLPRLLRRPPAQLEPSERSLPPDDRRLLEEAEREQPGVEGKSSGNVDFGSWRKCPNYGQCVSEQLISQLRFWYY